MTDWNKLKVPELKAELKIRGLSQVGLKAALVARLTDADSQSGFESEATESVDAKIHSLSSTNNSAENVPTLTESRAEKVNSAGIPQSSGSHTDGASPGTPVGNVSNKDPEFPQTSASEDTTQLSLSAAEVFDDKHKRKRRSQSPPPSEIDPPRKRARQDEAQPCAAPASLDSESSQVEGTYSNSDIENKAARRSSADTAVVTEAVGAKLTSDNAVPSLSGDAAKEEKSVEFAATGGSDGGEATRGSVTDTTTLPPASDGWSSATAKDTSLKGLLPGQAASNQISSSGKFDLDISTTIDTESDRIVSPSIHPATSALYIRDFMRPLSAATLKEYLIDLSTPPGATPNPEIIVDFYLDPIRTHAFVSFINVSAASRVRSELHNKVWPRERTRKPLWVDFIPPEKVPIWIADEQSASGGPRSAGKKWGVTYEVDTEGNLLAILQEVGTIMPPLRKPSTASSPIPAMNPGIEGAPSGPRAQNGSRAIINQRLDQLFHSTTTTPVLYYQPVSQDLASARLENIDKATSMHYSPHAATTDINRYTFEDGDSLVDRGPEIFSGIRPPPSYRGRRAGYRGRRPRYDMGWGTSQDSRARRY